MKLAVLFAVCVSLASCGPPALRQVDASAEYRPINTPEQSEILVRKHSK